jgi:hypothetical protein
MTTDQPVGPPGPRDPPGSAKELFRQHGEELLVEGKRSIRRVGIAALVIAVTAAVVLLLLVAVGAYALIHSTS